MRLAKAINSILKDGLSELGFEVTSVEQHGVDRKACHVIEVVKMQSEKYFLEFSYKDGGVMAEIGKNQSALSNVRPLANPELMEMTIEQLFEALPTKRLSFNEQCEELLSLLSNAIRNMELNECA